jgi:TolA-binding protein
MNLNDLANTLSDSTLAIAGALVAALLILNLKSILNAAREMIAEFNRGRKQDADAQALMMRDFITAGQTAFKDAVEVVTRMAENSVRRMEEMERELRDVRLESDRKDLRIAELEGRVKDMQRQLDEKTISGGDGDKKKRVTTKRSVAGRDSL